MRGEGGERLTVNFIFCYMIHEIEQEYIERERREREREGEREIEVERKREREREKYSSFLSWFARGASSIEPMECIAPYKTTLLLLLSFKFSAFLCR